jgi:DNA-directed RNA polymerase specialized sigma24 family protein
VPLDEALLARAAAFKIPAIEAVLTHYRPAVHRVAVALTGRHREGAAITRAVLMQAVRFARTWDDPAKVERWFYHHTIQSTRPFADRPPEPLKDALLPDGAASGPQAIAFVRALRSLPAQQREAFLLTHGEQLDPRPVATAMDCSLDASANHLVVATRTLKGIGGADYPRLELAVATAYASLTPAGDETLPLVRSAIRRSVWPPRIKRLVSALVMLVFLGALACAAWKVYPMIDW